MKTGFVQKMSRNTLMAFWTAVLVAMVLASAPCALASTAENTEITNNVTVTYDDANDIAQDPQTAFCYRDRHPSAGRSNYQFSWRHRSGHRVLWPDPVLYGHRQCQR
jgi:hypothetical protein